MLSSHFDKRQLATLLKVKKQLSQFHSKLKMHNYALQEHEDELYKFHELKKYKELTLAKQINLLEDKLKPYREALKELYAALTSYKVGLIGSLVRSKENIIEWRHVKYDAVSKAIILKIESFEQEFAPLHKAEHEKQVLKNASPPPKPPAPNSAFKIKEGAKTYSFDALRINEALLDSAIELKQEALRKKGQKNENLKAKAKAYDGKQRDLGKSIRNNIKNQLTRHPFCPYCGQELFIENAHADHIYPLAHGGLSTSSNMVFICPPCNQSKSDKTLREFLKENHRDEDQVHRILESLGKRF